MPLAWAVGRSCPLLPVFFIFYSPDLPLDNFGVFLDDADGVTGRLDDPVCGEICSSN